MSYVVACASQITTKDPNKYSAVQVSATTATLCLYTRVVLLWALLVLIMHVMYFSCLSSEMTVIIAGESSYNCL